MVAAAALALVAASGPAAADDGGHPAGPAATGDEVVRQLARTVYDYVTTVR